MDTIDQTVSKRSVKILYHYTAQSGLMGIVKNKCIWATNIEYLNDSEEFALAVKLMRAEIDVSRKACSDPKLLPFLDNAAEMVDLIQSVTSVYVSSFTENGDLLSQWRGYAPRGNGFSIGFDYENLKASIEGQGYFIAPCIYDESTQRQLVRESIRDLMEHLLDGITKWGSYDPTDDYYGLAYSNFYSSFCHSAPLIKHVSFSEEREWRAVSQHGFKTRDLDKIGYREGVSMVTPYRVINLGSESSSLPISEIIVGPTPHKGLSAQSVSMFMKAAGINRCVVKLSAIPYRGW